MKSKLAIFDMDGTLVDTSVVNHKSYQQAMNEYGYDISYEYYCEHCNSRHYSDFLPELIKEPDIIEKVHDRKKVLYPMNISYAKLNRHLINIIMLIKSEYYLSVVTTASRKNTTELLEYFDIFKLFDLVITHEDVQYPKPDPEGFYKAIEYFGLSPEQTMIFEDSQTGISAARQTKASLFVAMNFV